MSDAAGGTELFFPHTVFSAASHRLTSAFNFHPGFPIITVSLFRLEPRVSRSRSPYSRRPHNPHS